MTDFCAGDRVWTPLGHGTVAYVRMAPPDYARPMAVSVVLDARRYEPGYSGSTFFAAQVRHEGTGPHPESIGKAPL